MVKGPDSGEGTASDRMAEGCIADRMIVTIDGPAGAGKSSAARALAKRLGFRFLDTGAMYRAVVYAALQAGVDLEDGQALERIAQTIGIDVTDDHVFLDGQDVTGQIRTFDITSKTRYAADHPGVRKHLVELQRAAADGLDVVTEGRDQATVVFPHAECKIFLTASPAERARRRYHDLIGRHERVTYDDVLQKQQDRDRRDIERKVGGLIKHPDAIEVNTDHASPDEVVDRLETIVRLQASN